MLLLQQASLRAAYFDRYRTTLPTTVTTTDMARTVLATTLLALASGTLPEGPTEKLSQDVFYRSEKRFGSNTCSHAFDGDCDDGGSGSFFSLCKVGTDAHDCGDDSCSHSRDGDCDDGGMDSQYSLCSLGTDTTDCHDRLSPRGSPHGFGQCFNSCSHSGDGACDDGGMGAEYSLCAMGSDCSDCGIRHTAYLRAEAEAASLGRSQSQSLFPALREQKTAKSAAIQGRLPMHSAGAVGFVGSVAAFGLIVAVGLIGMAKSRRGVPATTAADGGPPPHTPTPMTVLV